MSGPSAGELLQAGIARLRTAGSESARLDAELLLASALGVERVTLLAHPDAPVSPAVAAAFERDLARRAAGEPVAYIRGMKEFFGFAFTVDSRALIPRPDTELLVELAVREVVARLAGSARGGPSELVRIVDVGTGCGTIAVSLAATLRRRRCLDGARLTATDRSGEALALARENAVGHGVADAIDFREADLLDEAPDGEAFDVVLANLPYIPSAVVPVLPVAASFEPRVALDGGADGLALIRRLVAALPRALAHGGIALLEIGSEQGRAIADLVAGLPGPGRWVAEVLPDLAGQPRVVRIERSVA